MTTDTPWNCPLVMVPFIKHLELTQPDVRGLMADLALYLVGLARSTCPEDADFRRLTDTLQQIMNEAVEGSSGEEGTMVQ